MAISYQFVQPLAGLPTTNGTMTYATSAGVYPPAPLGFIAGAVDATYGYAEFMLVQGASASTAAAGDWVALTGNSAGQAVSGNTGSQGLLGVAPAALSATNVVGWVQVMGHVDYAKATNASIAAGAPLFIGSAAGRVNSTGSATGFRIDGAFCAIGSYTSSQSNSLSAYLYYPTFQGR
jgi:hypothetical protein